MLVIPNRYNSDGPWLRGNTHVHTTKSDGAKDCATVAALYAAKGYDFLFVTDHGIVADAEGLQGLPLLAINGVEIDGTDLTGSMFHVVGLGVRGALLEGASLDEQIAHMQAAGALLVLAHPYWSGNTVQDALRHGFDGVEVYNTVCHYLNGKGQSTYLWDCMLAANARTLGFSADDTHMDGDQPWGCGWIMVAASSLSRDSIMASIRAGSFYSTQGPLFASIHAESGRIAVRTSPVRSIRLVGESYRGSRVLAEEGKWLTGADFDATFDCAYLRVEIEDDSGRRAWTNALMEQESPSGPQKEGEFWSEVRLA
jgi:hypothetical protein